MMEEYTDFATFISGKLKERGMQLKELSDVSGISRKYIEALLGGRFKELPAAPYLRGYVERIADVLDFDSAVWWERLSAEAGLRRSGANDALPENRYALRSKKYLWPLLVVLALVIYGIIRVPAILGKPGLTIASPQEETTSATEGHFILSGVATRADTLTINKDSVPLAENGAWEKQVPLAVGLNTFEIVAAKNLGRETKIIRQILYEPVEMATSTGQ